MMRCHRCQRTQGDSLRQDPALCRAHLSGFADVDRGADAKLDCWRTSMHTRAARAGLGEYVKVADRLTVASWSTFRPIAVIVPMSHVPPEMSMVNGDRVLAFQASVFAHVNGHRYSQDFTARPDDPPARVAYEITRMIDDLAIQIARAAVSWAS